MPGLEEPPYGVIRNELAEGLVIPFLGAGASVGSRRLPPATDPTEEPSDPPEGEPSFLPSGAGLAGQLAAESQFPAAEAHERTDLAKIASYFVEVAGRKTLKRRLRQIFDHNYQPCAVHRYLASIPRPMVLVTTNYDDLLERAFRDAGRAYDLVVHAADIRAQKASVQWWPHGQHEPTMVPPNELAIDLKRTTVIYKIHGSVHRPPLRTAEGREPVRDWDSYVITEDDYLEFLSRMTSQICIPHQFLRHFSKCHFLFMGYGLNDWNLRLLLKNLSSVLPADPTDEPQPAAMAHDGVEPDPSWAIQLRPSMLEKKLWDRRHVNIYDMAIDDFVARLAG
jgi:hypothetical protein